MWLPLLFWLQRTLTVIKGFLNPGFKQKGRKALHRGGIAPAEQTRAARVPSLPSACLPGTFGEGCAQICQCPGATQECHPVTGACVCAPGRHGPACQLGESALGPFSATVGTRGGTGSAGSEPSPLRRDSTGVSAGEAAWSGFKAQVLTGCLAWFLVLLSVAEVCCVVYNRCPALTAESVQTSVFLLSCPSRSPCAKALASAVSLAD